MLSSLLQSVKEGKCGEDGFKKEACGIVMTPVVGCAGGWSCDVTLAVAIDRFSKTDQARMSNLVF